MAMQLLRCGDVCRMRFFGAIEIAQRSASGQTDSRLPAPASPIQSDSWIAGGVVLLGDLVLHVLRVRHRAQIAKSVVRPVPINVINLRFRPDPMHVKPCQPMGFVDAVVNADDAVALAIDRTRNASSNTTVTTLSAGENAGGWLVVQNLFQSFSSQHFGTPSIGGWGAV